MRALAFALALAPAMAGAADPQPYNDFPTETRADYVFACMATNGQTRETLQRCSCAIDVIASILSFDQYSEAEAAISLLQLGGERVAAVRNSVETKGAVAELRRAQAEADIRCF